MATLLLLLLSLSGTDALRSHPHHTHSYGIGGPTHTYTPTALLSTTGTLFQDNDSDRLKKARLRLAEAQGIIPIGASETANSLGEFDLAMLGSQGISKVREISWRVAEPETSYDPQAAASKLFQQPVRWLGRNVQIFVPITVFAFKVGGLESAVFAARFV
ncbi:hypothetical protein B484DRAFT_245 [Ochromonadaceae sp. CCMP2298]|nr:hypothetical protein B484DRAFT_245 [Ochromonadaceae sp. CCMP2298]